MTEFEKKVNEYRENKRLLEELEALNDAIKNRYNCNDARRAGNGAGHCKGHLQRRAKRPT